MLKEIANELSDELSGLYNLLPYNTMVKMQNNGIICVFPKCSGIYVNGKRIIEFPPENNEIIHPEALGLDIKSNLRFKFFRNDIFLGICGPSELYQEHFMFKKKLYIDMFNIMKVLPLRTSLINVASTMGTQKLSSSIVSRNSMLLLTALKKFSSRNART